MRQLLHEWTGWTPRIIVGRLAHLALNFCVVHYDIGAEQQIENKKEFQLISTNTYNVGCKDQGEIATVKKYFK